MAGLSRWRLPLRVARRDALRHRGRTLLILALIAVPVVGLTAVDVILRASELTPAEQAVRQLGGADLAADQVSDAPVVQSDEPFAGWETEGEPPAGRPVAPELPPGTTVAELTSGNLTARTVAGERSVGAFEFPADSPLTVGLARVREGRLPQTSGEVAISPALAERVEAGVGDRLWLADGTAYDVVGIAQLPDQAGSPTLISAPGGLPWPEGDAAPFTQLLVGRPATQAEAVRAALNEAGFVVTERAWIENPPPADPGSADELSVGLTVVTVGLALLQVVLLAGAAFAVGSRRQRRAHGLLAANGGTGRDVGRSVLAGGLLLGAVAAVVGVAFGLLLAVPMRAVLEDRSGALWGAWRIPWWEVAVIAGLGLLTGLASAYLPARAAAREDPLRALNQRPDPPRSGRRLTVAGLGLAVFGVAVTVLGTTLEPVSYSLILGGAVAVELGFVLCAPALVGLAGRGAGRFPVPLRMALRDAARQRTRSGPAVAAVMAALAGCVAVSIFFVSQEKQAERDYIPTARPGQVVLYPTDDDSFAAEVADQVTAAVPGASLVTWQNASCTDVDCQGYAYVDVPVPGADDSQEQTQVRNLSLVVGGPEVIAAALGAPDEEAAAALAAGDIVALNPAAVVDGTVRVVRETYDASGSSQQSEESTVPAVAVDGGPSYTWQLAVMSQATADRLGLFSGGQQYLLDPPRPPTADDRDRLTALSNEGTTFSFEIEAGYESPAGPVLLALLGASIVVVLGATAVSTGLAAADGRADLSTLAAVGAAPRTRRLLAMSQAAVVALLGAILGAVAGFVPAAALIEAIGEWPLTIPWSLLGAVLVVVPLLAAGCAGLFTRSRLPMLRRVA